MVDESSPELRLLPGDTGGLPVVVREFSTFNFDIASLKRLDIASRQDHVSILGAKASGRISTPTFLAKIRRRQDARDWMAPGHLVQDLRKKSLLHLGCLLNQGVGSSSPFSLAENSEPLFDSAEFVLEILVECSSCHFF